MLELDKDEDEYFEEDFFLLGATMSGLTWKGIDRLVEVVISSVCSSATTVFSVMTFILSLSLYCFYSYKIKIDAS